MEIYEKKVFRMPDGGGQSVRKSALTHAWSMPCALYVLPIMLTYHLPSTFHSPSMCHPSSPTLYHATVLDVPHPLLATG